MAGDQKSDWEIIQSALIRIGEALEREAMLTLIGSTVTMSMHQPSRMTMDIDVWKKRSTFDLGDLKRACEQAGVLFNPKEFDVDGLYLQLIDRGIVDVGEYESEEFLFKSGNLSLSMPPPENFIASKLNRCNDQDIEDCLFLARKKRVTIDSIERAIKTISDDGIRSGAMENLVILEVLLEPHGLGRSMTPGDDMPDCGM